MTYGTVVDSPKSLQDLVGLMANARDGMTLRKRYCRAYRNALCAMAKEISRDALQRSAIVFSPHYDDETLGCGGTIIKKRAAGADLTIVFMTDGSKSHQQFMQQEELKEMRANEGIAATKVLGVDAHDVVQLGYEETKLTEHAEEAVQRVTELLGDKRPLDVFIPYQGDTHEDHEATARIVNAALCKVARRVTVYEYPVWYWQQWPFVTAPPQRMRWVIKRAALATIRNFRDFRWRVSISKQLADKRAALEQYRSQMARINANLNWPILADVSGGEFLECFFQEYELFSMRLFVPTLRHGNC